MAANLTVAANKRVRGEILALLYSVQPVPVEIRTITNSLLESNMVSVPSIAQQSSMEIVFFIICFPPYYKDIWFC